MSVAPRAVRQHPSTERIDDALAVEEPLEIRVEERSIAVLMRSPGHDLDLAAGFLRTEGVIEDRDDLSALAHLPGDPAGNTVQARLAAGVEAHLDALESATRALYASSSCGICGKASIDRLRIDLAAERPAPLRLPPHILDTLPAALTDAMDGFARTGGLHGAAAVDRNGQLLLVREDIGRHNAVDKVVGACLRADQPVDTLGILVSSRAGFEIVQKALVAGFGAVWAVGAASTLAVDLAAELGLPLTGFLRAGRHTVYVE